MEKTVARLKNWCWYHKTHILIAAAIIAGLLYMFAQPADQSEPDYHIGLVSTAARSEESLTALEAALAACGEDRDGDGQVQVQIHTYAVDLADSSENAGYRNYEIIAALDADLVGGVSGIFLLEDPDVFQQTTNGMLAEPFVLFDENLYLCLRSDAAPAYIQLFEKLV